MIRLVKEFVEKPCLLAMCERDDCGVSAMAEIVLSTDGPVMDKQIGAFVGTIQQQGWLVNIFTHLCPGHAEQAMGQRRMIEVPTGAIASKLKLR